MAPTYTVYVKWNVGQSEMIEELDVQASSAFHAETEAQQILDADYMPGGQIVRIEESLPGYVRY